MAHHTDWDLECAACHHKRLHHMVHTGAQCTMCLCDDFKTPDEDGKSLAIELQESPKKKQKHVYKLPTGFSWERYKKG